MGSLSKIIDENYFDVKRLDEYRIKYGMSELNKNEAYKMLLFVKRGNMDNYDLDIEDYIQDVAPCFYNFISAIRDGEWVYSNLDPKYYKIDNFEFDLEALYNLCREKRFL